MVRADTSTVPDEREKRGAEESTAGAPAEDPEQDRPTVSPPFDPVAFARDALKPSPAPMKAVVTPRDTSDAHTRATPAQGTAQQAASAKASRPSTRTRKDGSQQKTPTSTLSLANMRFASKFPPVMTADKRDPPMRDGLESENSGEEEWAHLELETRPPPADGPEQDPILEIAPHVTPGLELDDIESNDQHVADTVRRPVPTNAQEPSPSRAREMNDRMSLGDYSGALEIAEKILANDESDVGAKAVIETCRTVLRQMYATRIGPLDRVPVVMVPRDQLRWLSIDHKAGFVLSLVDGVSNLEMIIDVSGMPELDTLRILSELAQQRIIALR